MASAGASTGEGTDLPGLGTLPHVLKTETWRQLADFRRNIGGCHELAIAWRPK